MKRQLRTLFYWDVPAQGTFFALTLLFVFPRVLYTIGVNVVLPLFLDGGAMQFAGMYLLAALTEAVLVYSQVQFFHFVFILQPRPKGRDYLLMLCMAVVLLLVFFSCRLLGYERLWPLLLLTLYAFSLAKSFHPKAKVWEGLLAMAVLVAGVASFCALNVVEARLLAKLFLPWTEGTASLWGIGESPWLLWLLTFCSMLLLTGERICFMEE